MKQHHSTEIIRIFKLDMEVMDKKKEAALVLLDLSKAFYRIDLLKKLAGLGIRSIS